MCGGWLVDVGRVLILTMMIYISGESSCILAVIDCILDESCCEGSC